MTSENKARLKELQKLFKMASNAADYLNKKADECQEETRRALYIELAEVAEAEADKYFAEESPLWDELYEEVVKKEAERFEKCSA